MLNKSHINGISGDIIYFMLSSDMQSCTKKANVMYTGQGNKEQVSQDRRVGESLSDLQYNSKLNFISQKLIKLFERNFQRVFLYTFTASSPNLSSLYL